MSDDENSCEVDLWGNRIFSRKGKRGRPPFERTEENARKVSMLLAMGWSNSRIARCIIDPRTGKHISEPTLKRYFRSELQERDFQRDRLVARQLEVAATAAFDGGNVGAMRFLQTLVEKNDTMRAEERMGRLDRDEPKKEEKLGKKQTDAIAAEEADALLMAELEQEATSGKRH
ncbi:hypothetical protein CEW88_15530 [Alloyangia pacifica]|uniref:Uncharacterized protein n=1 Tax=Alloyangia pacifica TaxID=311180 RepID=A0A2U8HHR7_9RHOB|nr:hypothetical protein [Alloyangia pacifica]AWI85160.1 hypothetical protein CEW88_15530 [Alloyangia pacifica]